jgi:hypothetical protein
MSNKKENFSNFHKTLFYLNYRIKKDFIIEIGKSFEKFSDPHINDSFFYRDFVGLLFLLDFFAHQSFGVEGFN